MREEVTATQRRRFMGSIPFETGVVHAVYGPAA